LMRIQKKSLDDFANEKTDFISCRIMERPMDCRHVNVRAAPNLLHASQATADCGFPTTKGAAAVNPKSLDQSAAAGGYDESVLVDGREQKNDRMSFCVAAIHRYSAKS